MLIETVMPDFDVRMVEHVVVDADPAATFGAARALDFLTVRTPLLTLSMWIRGLPERWHRRRAAPPQRLTLVPEMGLPGWLLLGERPEREIAFGAVGTFWQPTIRWRDVPVEDFGAFDEPGWGKIAANFTVTPYGERSTLLSYECRTVITDPASRQRFLLYWWLIRPFVGHIMRATLETIKANAEPQESSIR
ncbi:hypothetical protein [Mycobacterium sp. SMC-4]|uniref:hypothetical protein n=1 Tax=Mycobacterium sp. SMC-4 TaxID=2857059 RepID=UPI0021B3C571|nr:hypothetical protein [Mycobacterium sp. SMC-4]UXA17017.1 hypothetical protein KXD98_19995 [Mycobacterium sp. SMC-4]